MKRKIARRIISLVIALMMTLSGTQVFFADTLPHDYDESDIVIDKTATSIGDNEYEIQLSVTGKAINTGKKADVILVIDNSASMHTAEYSGKKLAEITKDAANAFVDGVLTSANDLSGNVRIGVVKYGEQANARIFGGSGGWSNNWSDNLDLDNSTVYTSNKADAKSAVTKATEYVTNVGTNTEGGFLMAQKVAGQKRSDAESIVIFMTDGMPTYRYSGTNTSTTNDSSGSQTSRKELNEAIEAAQSLGANSKIYTIALLSAVQSSSNQAKLASNLLSLSPYKYISSGIFNNPSNIMNDVNKTSKWIATTKYAEKYFPIFSVDNAAAKMTEIYGALAGGINALANGYVTDIIHKDFELTADSKDDLQDQGVTVTENDDGTTTLVFPDIDAGGTINNLPIIIVKVKPGIYGTDYTNVEAIYTFKLFGEQTEKTKEFPKPIVPIDPVAADDNYSVYKDLVLTVTSLGILNNDTPLKVVAGDYTVTELAVENTYVTNITTNKGGTAVVSSDGSFVYTPPSGYTGKDTFVYKNMATVSGGGVLNGDYVSDIATVTINVLPIPVNEIPYTVEYYKDEIIMAGETESGLVPIGNPVVYSVDDKIPEGYVLDEEASTELPFTVTEEKNVIKIYYVKETVPEEFIDYTVEYYKDGDLFETVPGTVAAGNPVVDSVDDKTPTGYGLDEEASTELPFTVTEEKNVIKIYYVKETVPVEPVDYTVEYYVDGELVETVPGTVAAGNPVVDSVDDKTPAGYVLDEEASTELPFTVTEENNVIKIYYVKETVPVEPVDYTVEYYVDGELVETVPGTVAAGNPVVDSVDDKTPAGYVLDEEASTELPFTVTEEKNVIKIYYVKDTDPEEPELEDNVIIVKHYTKTGTATRVLAKTDSSIPVTTSSTIYGTVYKDNTIVSQGFKFDSSNPESIDVYPRTTTESAIKQFVFELLYTKSGSGGGGGGGGGGGNPPTVIDDPLIPLAELEKTDHFAYTIGYPEGDVRPLNNITREEVAMIFYRLLTDESRDSLLSDTNPFTDMDSDRWSNRAISTLFNADIISGYPDGTFRPSDPITRAEFATIAAKFDDLSLENTSQFTDITGHWAEKYITSSENKGWIKGYPDMTFKPEQDITRAEAMTLINNVLERNVPEENIHPDAMFWPDNSSTQWYYEAVMEATNSHDYVYEEDGDELWTGMKPNKVWP